MTFHICLSSKRFCSIRLPNFFVNESLLYFEEGRNHVAFIIGKFDFETRKSDQYLATAWRGFEAHKFVTSTKQNALPPLPPNRFFYHPDSGWSCDQPQPGSFFQRPREGEKRDPGNEVGVNSFVRSPRSSSRRTLRTRT